jgi:predicted RNA-binding protein with PIN domain
MIHIDEQALPPAILEVWKEALGRLGDSDLRALAVKQGLNSGFRPNKMDLGVARARLRASLDKLSDLPEDYGVKLRAVTLSGSLLGFLSEAAILTHVTLLTDGFGQAQVLAALLLDERQALRNRGLALLAAWDGQEPGAGMRQTASKALLDAFRPFLRHLEQLLTEFEPSPPAVQGTPDSRAPEKNPRQQAERLHLVTALRDKRKEASQLRRELETVRAERDRLRMAVSGKERVLAEEQDRAASLGLAQKALQDEFEARVSERVQALLDERLQPWLKPAERLGQIVRSAQDSSLLDRADELLRQQAEVDRRYGLRSRLQAELDRAQATLATIQTAQTESLNPLPALAILERELDSRVAELQNQLGTTSATPKSDNPLITQLMRTLGTAPSLETIASVRRALHGVEPLGLLSDADLQQAYALVQDASSRVYARSGSGRSLDTRRSDLRELPLYALQAQLAHGKDCTVVVDGHNVLYTLPTLFRTLFENGQPGLRARNALVQRVVTLGQRHPRLSIQLWFDGPVQQELTASNNVRIHFSGGTGSDRADLQIVAYLRHMQAAFPQQMRAVVTADMAEALDAERTGAMVLAPQELAIWLG